MLILPQVEGVGPTGTSGGSCTVEKPSIEAPKMPMHPCGLVAACGCTVPLPSAMHGAQQA